MNNLPTDKNQVVDNNQGITNNNSPRNHSEVKPIPTATEKITPKQTPETALPPSPPREEQLKPEEQPILKEEKNKQTIEIGSLEQQPSFTSYTQNTPARTDDDSRNKKTKKLKTIVSTLGLLLIIIALPITVILVKQRQEIRKEAAIATDIKITVEKETPPTVSNGATFSTTFRVANTTSVAKTLVLEKLRCHCSAGGGNPPGGCHDCLPPEKMTINLGGGESTTVTLSIKQPNGTVCGSYQTDLKIISVK